MMTDCEKSDLIVFSHLRWDFVYQRPQHLMARFAKYRRVYFFEEPIPSRESTSYLEIKLSHEGVFVVIPCLIEDDFGCNEVIAELLDRLMLDERIENYNLWYYTPMALNFSRHLRPRKIIYDMMDELSLFKGAPYEIQDLEGELLGKAQVVFTGGHSLFEAKQHRHTNIHAVPSSIDFTHFAKSRQIAQEPEDQAGIPHPRVGFYGVIDERTDVKLLGEMARLRPDISFVMVGPIVKINASDLPKLDNIYYLGQKTYRELPAYVAGWDCAMMPFALNDSTRYISPTKTPEFLAAGRPVVSTAIRDVVKPYAELGFVQIAETAEQFIDGIEKALGEKENLFWLHRVDKFLSTNSWDQTWKKMAFLEQASSQPRPRLGLVYGTGT